MTAECTFRGYKIRAEYLGNKAADWGDKMPENYNNHRVTVSKSGRRTSFEFWASIMEPELRSPSDLCNAFSCFLSDAMSGRQDFEGFCQEFGYDSDSRKAEKIHRACERAAAKAERLLAGDDIYSLYNALNDQ